MKTTMTTKIVLLFSGLIITGIGVAVLFFPTPFYATNGIELGTDPSLLNEVRASGGALIGAGGLILAGFFVSTLATLSMIVAAGLYGMYGVSRLFSMVIDGVPDSGLIGAAGFELFVSAFCLFLLIRERAKARQVIA